MKKIKLNKLQKEMLTAQVLTSRMVAGLDPVPDNCKLKKFSCSVSFWEIKEIVQSTIKKNNKPKQS